MKKLLSLIAVFVIAIACQKNEILETSEPVAEDNAWVQVDENGEELSTRAIPTVSAHRYTIFPNPFDDHITIVGPSEDWGIYNIYDISAALVLSGNIYEGYAEVDTSSLYPGIYVCRIILANTLHGESHKGLKY